MNMFKVSRTGNKFWSRFWIIHLTFQAWTRLFLITTAIHKFFLSKLHQISSLFYVNITIPGTHGSNLTKSKLFLLTHSLDPNRSFVSVNEFRSYLVTEIKTDFQYHLIINSKNHFYQLEHYSLLKLFESIHLKNNNFKVGTWISAWAGENHTFENVENIDRNRRINNKINFVVEF